jgi:hypothetical protein
VADSVIVTVTSTSEAAKPFFLATSSFTCQICARVGARVVDYWEYFALVLRIDVGSCSSAVRAV